MKSVTQVWGMLAVAALVQATARADDAVVPAAASSAMPLNSRYGLFNALDHRSWYNEGNFPEPFLVDDSGLEVNEARLDWTHTTAGSSHSDGVRAEVEKGFGLLTLEVEVPYERGVSPDGVVQGFDNIDLGVRHPLFQYVSPKGFFDNTLGAAFELGVPVNSPVSKNTELVPKIFNDLRLGEHFTVQSIFGYSTLLGGGEDGGKQAFEYGFDFGYSIEHSVLPIPGVRQFIPMFELVGETGLNQGESGHNSLTGNACFRLNLKNIGRVQPRLGLGFIFPINNNARADVHCGVVTSLVFEY
ncbi:MAG: hypothetical protein P4N60_21810 [Verrucomicrobiae bacterium]|nr:hypothetical protein [Verrucomicrobiae bacterium]